jgi:putative aminopeptidase FrvX
MELLKKLCNIHATSGNESLMTDFILDYVHQNQNSWKVQPKVVWGEEFQECVVLVFGTPRTAVFAHIDSIGYTVRYNNELVPVGSPHSVQGTWLTGIDSKGPIRGQLECKSEDDEEGLFINFGREIDRGTDLVFECDFRETNDFVESCYIDNRLGVWNALRLSETLENGIIVFSCGEEHGGGSVPYLAKYIYEQYQVRQALISDITWVTEGVEHGKGVVISLRDRSIPRKKFVDKVVKIASVSSLDFQLEVEGSGGSDGRELQASPYPFDWCFIGAAESGVHSPNEKVHKKDIASMLFMYELLMKEL